MNKKTLVFGASTNIERYSNKAVKKLKIYNHNVVAFGIENAKIDDVQIDTTLQNYDKIDTVTLYINPSKQQPYYNYFMGLKPKRIIFNPGTENEELIQLAKQNNIETLEACTLVLLSTNQY